MEFIHIIQYSSNIQATQTKLYSMSISLNKSIIQLMVWVVSFLMLKIASMLKMGIGCTVCDFLFFHRLAFVHETPKLKTAIFANLSLLISLLVPGLHKSQCTWTMMNKITSRSNALTFLFCQIVWKWS